uniref:Uncharacterized protein CZA382.12 n=1 Tax=Amycolatopsis orientalis TaxID=31958 RepID=Q9XBD9_AMYOR|nr:hypothetical protein [Amycolatopsis orientalis]
MLVRRSENVDLAVRRAADHGAANLVVVLDLEPHVARDPAVRADVVPGDVLHLKSVGVEPVAAQVGVTLARGQPVLATGERTRVPGRATVTATRAELRDLHRPCGRQAVVDVAPGAGIGVRGLSVHEREPDRSGDRHYERSDASNRFEF